MAKKKEKKTTPSCKEQKEPSLMKGLGSLGEPVEITENHFGPHKTGGFSELFVVEFKKNRK